MLADIIMGFCQNYLPENSHFSAVLELVDTTGRPPVSKETRELILKLKKENLLWGARRIRDELKKLSIEVSHETISKILNHFRKKGDIKPNLS